MKNCITFYYEDNSEKDIFSPIAEEAKKEILILNLQKTLINLPI